MRKLCIVAFVASLGVTSLGAWFVPPAFGAIKVSMQKKAERDIRDRLSIRSNPNAAKTEQDIIVEIDRYLVFPGQALGYKMGQLEIRRLRANAERTLGSRFDVRGFHDVVLGQGAVPLDVMERQVNAWIAKNQK